MTGSPARRQASSATRAWAFPWRIPPHGVWATTPRRTPARQWHNSIYARLAVTLTDADLAPESFYNPMLADVCDELQAAGVAVISDGALCAFPPGFTGRDGSPLPLILRKSDGGYGYASTDMAAPPDPHPDPQPHPILYLL